VRKRGSRHSTGLAVWLAVLTTSAGTALADYTSQRPAGTGLAPPGAIDEAIMFWTFAAGAIVCTLGIVVSTSVVRMAAWLLGVLVSVAALYFLMAANFLGAIQLIVYAGGVLVLIVFGVMLTGHAPGARLVARRIELLAGAAVCTVLLAVLASVLLAANWQTSQTPAQAGSSVSQMGTSLLTTYLVPFEAASVLLLVVMIGAAYLARPQRSDTDRQAAERG